MEALTAGLSDLECKSSLALPGSVEDPDILGKGVRDAQWKSYGWYHLWMVVPVDEKQRIRAMSDHLFRQHTEGVRIVGKDGEVAAASIDDRAVPAEVPVEHQVHLLDGGEVVPPVDVADPLL